MFSFIKGSPNKFISLHGDVIDQSTIYVNQIFGFFFAINAYTCIPAKHARGSLS